MSEKENMNSKSEKKKINKLPKRKSYPISETLVKCEKYYVPFMCGLFLVFLLVNIFLGSDNVVLAARGQYELNWSEGTGASKPVSAMDRILAVCERSKTVMYNSYYWKVRANYQNVLEMFETKSVIREKFNDVMVKITGDESYHDNIGLGTPRITPAELGFSIDNGDIEEY